MHYGKVSSLSGWDDYFHESGDPTNLTYVDEKVIIKP